MVQKPQRESIAIICTIEICCIGDIAEIVWTFLDPFRCAVILCYGNCNDYLKNENERQYDNKYVHNSRLETSKTIGES